MKIPEKIKIGGFIVTVELVNNIMTDRGRLGEYHPRTQIIKIDKDCSEQQKIVQNSKKKKLFCMNCLKRLLLFTI